MSRLLTRWLTSSLAGCLTIGALATFAYGQSPRPTRPNPAPAARPANAPPAQGERRPRPAAEPLRVEPVTPELLAILQQWEASGEKIQRLTGKHTRFVYDYVFEVEKRSKGEFLYVAPDMGSFEIEPISVPKGAVGAKVGKSGSPFKLEPDLPERWVCNGKEILKIDDQAKTYEMVVIPPEGRGQNIIDGPLPFLFGMKADQAQRRYALELLKETEREVWLKAIPRLQQDAVNYREATIILDRETFLPRAVRLIDPSGNKETVHAFKDLTVNGRPNLFGLGSDPLKPNLASYKRVLNDKGVQAADVQAPQAPPGQTRTNRPIGPNPIPRTATNGTPRLETAPGPATPRKPAGTSRN